METEHVVRCKVCGLEHDARTVKFLNVEEDEYGRDVMYFECILTGEETSSLVFRKSFGDGYEGK